MALLDNNLTLSSAQAITTSAQSTNAYDLFQGTTLAVASGAYTSTQFVWGNSTYPGEELGLGRGMGTPQVEVFSGPGTPISATSLQIAFQGAPDAGTGNTSGVTYVTYIEQAAIVLANILASSRLAQFAWPASQIKNTQTRFVALDYIVVGTFSGLTVNAYINLGGTSAQTQLGQFAANY